jgi:hypothetical protein
MKLHCLTLAAAALCVSAAAFAQYQWIDENGHRVFSDRPAPAGTPEKNIISGPGMRPASADDGASKAKAPDVPTPAKNVDGTLQERVKQAQAGEEAKKRQREAQIAAARADNCKRARNAKATLDSGMRMARLNDKGERIVLDDAQRAAELKRTNAIIASDCN